MKKIYFDKANSWFNGILIISALICIFIGIWKISEISDSGWVKMINLLGYTLLLIVTGKMYLWKYYINWNRRGMILRFKTLVPKTVAYHEIGHIDVNNEFLTIRKKNGNRLKFDIKEIRETDVWKLKSILTKHTVANNG